MIRPSNYEFKQTEKKKNEIEIPPGIVALVEAYVSAGQALDKDVVMEYKLTRQDQREVWFHNLAAKRKDAYKITINSIYRVKTKKGDEYYLYHAQKRCLDGNGKAVDIDGLYGFHKNPIAGWSSNSNKNGRQPVVTGYTRGYELKWDKAEVKKLLDSSDIPVEQFHVAREGNGAEACSCIYTINNVQDWLEGPFEDLWDLSRLGLSYPEPSLYLIEQGRKKERENREASLGMRINDTHYG